jgi:WD40 repeat protein
MAWDREAQQLRWRRDDLIANCGAFVPRSKRFICGLENGEVLELDAVTGRTLRKLADHRRWVSELAVSPRGDYVASIDLDGRLVVSDLARGQVVWSLVLRRFVPGMSAGMIARPAFTSNGDALAVVDLAHGATIDFVRPVDGLVVNRLPVRGRIVKGLAVAKNETCYSWDFGGTIAVWHPGQSPAIRRFSPAPSWLAHASELTITRRL